MIETFARRAGLPCDSRVADLPVDHVIEGRALRFAQPITLTPYASARPCSARCTFCSETRVRRDAVQQAEALRPGAGWHDGLRRVLDALAGLRVGASISGLETIDDAAWLEGVLAAFEEHEARADGRGFLGEKVLYTNAAGLAGAAPRLARFGLTRAEVSRHHADAGTNDAIMRFRPGVAVREGAAFADAMIAARAHVPLRLVCVVQARGARKAARTVGGSGLLGRRRRREGERENRKGRREKRACFTSDAARTR